ncbi:MAG: FHA domain-containing protein [Clostridiales Family XIII bacterium]|jgi:hypothetical protein|nr:FHA domain-containing protein [Clostridiales Family XIII bacterium]
MELVRCENGHFYDGEQYSFCPHCSSQRRNDDLTVGLTQDAIDDPETAMLGLADSIQSSASYAIEDSETVSFYDQTLGLEPVVGWLICVEGYHLGRDFRLKAGRNFVGRSPSMDVALTNDDTVSREKHAIVVYDPLSHKFLIQPGESKELSYLNDNAVMASTELRPRDVIKAGATKLMFFACCDEYFNWEMLQEE